MSAGALAGVVAITGGAWYAGSRVRSPAEAAATANPPVASRITAPVESRVLESTVISRGTVRYGDPREVVLASSSIKNGATAIPPALIISVPAVKGSVLAEGDKALEVGGRPVLILQGKNPAYRDMRPGDNGPDVKQLEDALARLGLNPGSADGAYDDATARAVEDWYRKTGYEAYGPTESQRTAINAARDAVGRAEDGVLNATRGVTTARSTSSADKLLAVDERIRSARARVQTAHDDAARNTESSTGTVATRAALLELGKSQAAADDAAVARFQRDNGLARTVEDASIAVADAQAAVGEATAARDDAVVNAANATRAITEAQTALDVARADLDRAKRTRPTIPTADPSVFVLSDNADAIRAAEGVVRSTESALRTATSNADLAQRAIATRDVGIATAQRAVTRTINALERVKAASDGPPTGLADLQQKAATSKTELARLERDLVAAQEAATANERLSTEGIRAANAAVKVAAAERTQLLKTADVRIAQAQLATAQQTKDRAAKELATLQAKTGIVVPANEVLFFDDTPVRVDDVKALRGTAVTGPVMTVTTSKLAVDSSVDAVDARLLKVGAKVVIESNEFNVTLPGIITELATTPGTKGVDPTKVYFAATPEASSEVDATSLNGASVKITIPVQSTGKEVLSVPESAVSIGPDGSARVEVEETPGGATRFVTVRTGVSAGGYVAVTPIKGSLKVGDNVTTGDASAATIEGTPGPEDAPSDTAPDSVAGDTAAADSAATDSVATDSAGSAAAPAETTVAP
jgi:hypothetical protein